MIHSAYLRGREGHPFGGSRGRHAARPCSSALHIIEILLPASLSNLYTFLYTSYLTNNL